MHGCNKNRLDFLTIIDIYTFLEDDGEYFTGSLLSLCVRSVTLCCPMIMCRSKCRHSAYNSGYWSWR